MATIPPIATPFTLVSTMTVCSLSAQDATTFSTEIFMDDFQKCRYISNKYINDSLKNFITLPVAQG